MAFETLQVPDEPGVWFCDRHRSTKTRLRCGRCERPICPKCTVMGPTGARCSACLSNRSSHMYQVAPAGFALAFGAAALGGVAGAFLVRVIGPLWLFALLYAPVIGPVLGRLVVRVTRGKRGPKLALCAIAGMVLGAILGGLVTGTLFSPVLLLIVAVASLGIWGFLK